MSTSVPKFIGSETELGHHCLDACFDDPAAEACDALMAAHVDLLAETRESDLSSCYEFDSDGFRCYRDHSHFEMSTPQVESATDFVLVQRLLREKLLSYKTRAEEAVGRMSVYFNNTNREKENGTSWGHHMNVLVSREAFIRWSEDNWCSNPMRAHFAPWICTSSILIGTGKVGAENGAPAAPFQLSQRADWIDRYSCLETVEHKALLNQRDEPHSNNDRYARLHMVFMDSPRAEFAIFLRAGMIQCMLAALESDLPLPNLELQNPLRALAQVSRDLTFTAPLQLSDGRSATALEIQYRLAEAIQDAVLAGTSVSQVPQAKFITELWIKTLDDISNRSPRLMRRLDWRARLEFIRKGRNPKTPRSELLSDLQFGEVGGVFDDLEAAGAMEKLEDFLPELSGRMPRLPDREHARAKLIERFSEFLIDIDWEKAVVRNANDGLFLFSFDDPLDSGRSRRNLDSAATWDECLSRAVEQGAANPCEVYEISLAEGGSTDERT